MLSNKKKICFNFLPLLISISITNHKYRLFTLRNGFSFYRPPNLIVIKPQANCPTLSGLNQNKEQFMFI